jgi:hypothetical protein
MNAAAVALREAPDADPIDMVSIVEANPVVVLLEPEKFDILLAQMQQESRAHVADVTTEKGRKAIGTVAFKVSRTKTAIEAAAKGLTEDWRKKTQAVNATRNHIVETLDALRDEILRPRTEWEAAEEARVEHCAAVKTRIRSAGIVSADETAAAVLTRADEIAGIDVTEDVYRAEYQDVLDQQARAVEALRTAAARIAQEEADRAELAKLRAEAAERQRVEDERAAAEAAEARRVADEQAQAARIAEAEKRAQEAAMAAAEQRAREEREAVERQHAAALRAEQDKAAEAERLRIEAEDRAARERADAAAAAARAAAEDAARAADREHRSAIMSAAKAAIMTAGQIDEAAARRVVLAIVAGSIPNTSIKF